MDKNKFDEKSPGKLIEIKAHTNRDWSFIPDPLPKNINFSENIWPLLVSAHTELARLDGLGRHMPNYELLLKPLQQREALRSSSLEGTYATPEQLLLYEIDPKEPKSPRDPANSWKEVFNYSNALQLGQKLLDEIPFSLRFFRELHNELLKGVRGYQRDPGNFRRSQVHIGSDRRFVPPPPLETIACLEDLEKYIHEENEIDPLIFCFMVHYQFEAIHPFLDGNGRVGRLLLSLMIFIFCSLKSPWLYLSAFFDKYKDEYIKYLFNVSSKNDWESWLTFCLNATIHEARDAITRFDKLVALKENYQNRLSSSGGNIRLYKIIDMIFNTPIVTIPELCRKNNVSYPTANSDIKLLIELNLLTKFHQNSRPKIFFAGEVMDLAYRDLAEND